MQVKCFYTKKYVYVQAIRCKEFHKNSTFWTFIKIVPNFSALSCLRIYRAEVRNCDHVAQNCRRCYKSNDATLQITFERIYCKLVFFLGLFIVSIIAEVELEVLSEPLPNFPEFISSSSRYRQAFLLRHVAYLPPPAGAHCPS